MLNVHRTRSGIHLIAPSLPRILNDALSTTEVQWECHRLTFQIRRIEVVLGKYQHSLLEPFLGNRAGTIVISDPGLLWKIKGTMGP